jgi:hypothetical protein
MVYLLMQLHFYLYTHSKFVDSYVIPLLFGALVGLCVAFLLV